MCVAKRLTLTAKQNPGGVSRTHFSAASRLGRR